MLGFLNRLFVLMVGHAVADFALQPDAMARGKNRHQRTVPPPGASYQATWFYWLSAHGLIHGGAVALATGSPLLGALESACHIAIDFGKCENWYGIHRDQTMHLVCKLAWCLLVRKQYDD